MTRLTDVIRAAAPTIPVGIVQRFGTVEDVAPIRVRMDGDQQAVPVSFIALCRPRKDDRVSIHIVGTMRIITGIIGGDSTPDNTIVVGGVPYVASGVSGPPPISYVQSYAPVYVARGSIPTPYVPPAGYGFDVYTLSTTGYTWVSVYGQSATSIGLNVLQVGNATESTLSRVGWRLIKL